MTEFSPNERQRELIEGTEGVYLADAGPGTGKTFTVTQRYAGLIDGRDTEPEDVLLVTFTDNAATEMRERVVDSCEYTMAALRDAPINTFHGHCHELLTRHGFDAPSLLGIDDHITDATNVLENEVLEAERFRTFLAAFSEDHPEHRDTLRILNDRTSLLGLIKQLAAKGVFPTATGWYRDGRSHLAGDRAAFLECFEAANEPNEGARGPTQSDLMNALSGFDRNRCYRPEAPSEDALREGEYSIDAAWADRAFEEDRESLFACVHDLYHEYIAFALERNYLNFGFLQMFAYVLLCEDHALREDLQFEYVMVDEFQDTSEIQFKLALLLCGTKNLCVVGDWKQSIYAFQYADVENIRAFESRLSAYRAALNADAERVHVTAADVEKIRLTQNYRSTQSIIDFSTESFTVPATSNESVDESVLDDVTDLEATTEQEDSRIETFTSEDEHEALLDRIQEIVDSDAYEVRDGEDIRPPTYEDIAVLTRTRRFGREFQTTAQTYDIPVAYEGGVELFTTEQAILLLAWLRILENEHADRGWAVVLEEAGYSLAEVRKILRSERYPPDMRAFRERLAAAETVGGAARTVFDRYGYEDAYADGLVAVLQETFDETTRTRGDIVRFFEDSLAADATHEVADSPGGDSITVQTIHAAKGLEHPIVIVANMNEYRFPPTGGGADRIRYEEPIGLRQTKIHDDAHGQPHTYDNWRYRVLSACLDRDYDEERRLLYVAMSRAESHLLFSAGAAPSPFFDALPLDPAAVVPEVEAGGPAGTEQAVLEVGIPTPDAPAGQSPHSLMNGDVFDQVEEGRGPDYGELVHDFAEAYAGGADIEPSDTDQRHIASFLDGLPGEVRIEENAYLPITVDGRRVTISGIVDLLHVTDDQVDIVDYKTDLGRHGRPEYRKQLSVYYHVVSEVYPEREVTTSIFWTADGDREYVESHTREELGTMVDLDERSRPDDDQPDWSL